MQEEFTQAGNSLILGAEADGELAGYLAVEGGIFSRNRHSAYIVTGILKQYQGKGIGGTLFREMDRWARQCGLVRLDLTVMRHNEAAVSLYAKQGFEIEGVKPKSLLVDGELVDEYYMGKIYN